MSYTSSLSNGAAIVGAGDYEGAPAEFDPMGNNVGLSNPYVEQFQPPAPKDNFPYFPTDSESPMSTNPHRRPVRGR